MQPQEKQQENVHSDTKYSDTQGKENELTTTTLLKAMWIKLTNRILKQKTQTQKITQFSKQIHIFFQQKYVQELVHFVFKVEHKIDTDKSAIRVFIFQLIN